MKLAERMGYQRDPRIAELMEHLRTTRSHRPRSAMAVIIPELDREQVLHYPPILGLLQGVQEVADLAGFGLDTLYLADPGMTPRRVRSILTARGIKGVVLAPFASGVASMEFNVDGFCAATAGYSIVEPRLSRACPNYLQMMDETLAACSALGYERIGFVMTYGEGGVGHKLFTSSFLYYQAKIPALQRVPILPKPEIEPVRLRRWLETHQPDVVVSAASVYHLLRQMGWRIPRDIGFASIDISEAPTDAAGADHSYRLVGQEALKLVLTALNLNLTGLPPHPKTVLVDSHQRAGFSLQPRETRHHARQTRSARNRPGTNKPTFHGFQG